MLLFAFSLAHYASLGMQIGRAVAPEGGGPFFHTLQPTPENTIAAEKTNTTTVFGFFSDCCYPSDVSERPVFSLCTTSQALHL